MWPVVAVQTGSTYISDNMTDITIYNSDCKSWVFEQAELSECVDK